MSLEEASPFIDTPSAPAAPYINAAAPVPSAIPSPSSEHVDDHQPIDGVLGTGRVEVTVSDPTKVGDGMSAYTVFKVTTKIVSASARIFVVQRRYSDFEWLQSQLSHDFPGIIIPPLPEKSFIGRFSSDFVEARQRGLEKFMLRILNHKLLSKCKDLPTFVMANEQNLETVKASTGNEVVMQKAKGIFDYFSDISSTLSSSFAPPKEKPRTADDVTCDDISTYATSLESILQGTNQNTEKMLAQSKVLANAWLEFGLSFNLLGVFESEQKEMALGNAFQKLGHCADRLSVLYNQKASKESLQFHEPVQDYLRLVDSIKNMMKSRAAVSERVARAQGNLDAKVARAASLKEYTASASQISAADQEVREAEECLAIESKQLSTVTRRVMIEINNFRKLKGVEFKQFILDFVHLQVEYSKKVQAAWESIIPEIESL